MTRSGFRVAQLAIVLLVTAPPSPAQPDVRQGSFMSTGLTLHYSIRGNGSPVVLLSGGPGLEAGYMEPLAEMLAVNHTAILLEQRGTGRSIPPVMDAASINEELMISDLEALRTSLHYAKWTLLGHSFGSFTAMRYAIAHPAETQALVLLASVAPSSSDDHFFENLASRTSPATAVRMSEIKDLEKNASADDRKKLELENGMLAVAPFFFNVENAKPLLGLPEPPPTRAETNRLLFLDYRNFDLTPGLKRLRVPVLIFQGRQDPLDLEMAARTRDAIPGAKLVIAERCGHFAWLEAPDQLRSVVLAFLSAQ